MRHVVLGGHRRRHRQDADHAPRSRPRSVDEAFAALQRVGVDARDLSVSRIDFARPVAGGPMPVRDAIDDRDALVWAEVADAAAENVGLRAQLPGLHGRRRRHRRLRRASEGSPILIVGAMAVSPDLLPMSAACVALVARRPRLAGPGASHAGARPRPRRARRLRADPRPAARRPGLARPSTSSRA